MRGEILEEFTFGDVTVVAERVVDRKNLYRLRFERILNDEVGPVGRMRHLFESDVVELEQLCGDVSRAALRMSGWLQEYASVRHRREKPKAKSALGLRLGE